MDGERTQHARDAQFVVHMKKTTHVVTYLASPVSDEKIPCLVIEAKSTLGPDFKTLRRASERHEEEGRKIADALLEHLPGGTVDQVLRFLLEHHASLLIVRHVPRTRKMRKV